MERGPFYYASHVSETFSDLGIQETFQWPENQDIVLSCTFTYLQMLQITVHNIYTENIVRWRDQTTHLLFFNYYVCWYMMNFACEASFM